MQPRDLKLGLMLPTWTAALNGATPSTHDVIDIAQTCEAVGYDSVWMADHFYFEPYLDYRVVGVDFPDEYAGIKAGAWECWSIAAALAIATHRVAIGTLVSNTGYRNPALFARQVDTVDDLSRGRVILGLGAGDFETEYRAFGYNFERRISRFEEALAIIKPLMRGDEVTFNGEFYSVAAARLEPKAARTKGPLIMIGCLKGGPRMTRLIAQHADMWNCIIGFLDSSITNYRAASAPVLAACEKYQRDPATLIRHVTVGVQLGDDPFPVPNSRPFKGSAMQIAERFAEYAADGVQHVSMMLHPWTKAGVEQFARVIELLRR